MSCLYLSSQADWNTDCLWGREGCERITGICPCSSPHGKEAKDIMMEEKRLESGTTQSASPGGSVILPQAQKGNPSAPSCSASLLSSGLVIITLPVCSLTCLIGFPLEVALKLRKDSSALRSWSVCIWSLTSKNLTPGYVFKKKKSIFFLSFTSQEVTCPCCNARDTFSLLSSLFLV